MPRLHLTKSAIDLLPIPAADVVHWDDGLPGFGLKVTPKGRKVFIALYRTGGAGSKLRKYTIGPYGKITLHHARIAAQKVFAAKLEGRDPAAEKREAKRQVVQDVVDVLLEEYISQRLAQNRSGNEIARLLRREIGQPWSGRSIHQIKKRDVVDVITAIAQRAPAAANKTLKSIKTFFNWCIGRAVLDRSPAEGVPLPSKAVARDRVLSDEELKQVILAARKIGSVYGAIVELLALTGQRREEVSQLSPQHLDMAGRIWTIPSALAKNSKSHIVQLSDQALVVLERWQPWLGEFVFSCSGRKPFQDFANQKRELDRLSGVTGWRLHDLRRTCVSGIARLGVAPHVADKILNHQTGTISGVAAVYQRHQFLEERHEALCRWGAHVDLLTKRPTIDGSIPPLRTTSHSHFVP